MTDHVSLKGICREKNWFMYDWHKRKRIVFACQSTLKSLVMFGYAWCVLEIKWIYKYFECTWKLINLSQNLSSWNLYAKETLIMYEEPNIVYYKKIP